MLNFEDCSYQLEVSNFKDLLSNDTKSVGLSFKALLKLRFSNTNFTTEFLTNIGIGELAFRSILKAVGVACGASDSTRILVGLI